MVVRIAQEFIVLSIIYALTRLISAKIINENKFVRFLVISIRLSIILAITCIFYIQIYPLWLAIFNLKLKLENSDQLWTFTNATVVYIAYFMVLIYYLGGIGICLFSLFGIFIFTKAICQNGLKSAI